MTGDDELLERGRALAEWADDHPVRLGGTTALRVLDAPERRGGRAAWQVAAVAVGVAAVATAGLFLAAPPRGTTVAVSASGSATGGTPAAPRTASPHSPTAPVSDVRTVTVTRSSTATSAPSRVTTSAATPSVAPRTSSRTGRPTLITPGRRISLQAVNYPGYLVRHRDFVARIDPVSPESAAGDRADAAFVVRAGLADGKAVSLEAGDYPGYFLTVADGAVYLRKNDGTAAFAAGATFRVVPGLDGIHESLVTASGLYLRHSYFVLYAQPDDGTPGFRQDASFGAQPAVA